MEVETGIDFHAGSVVTASPDKTNLVEARHRLLSIERYRRIIETESGIGIRLCNDACRKTYHAFTEETDAGRVARHG